MATVISATCSTCNSPMHVHSARCQVCGCDKSGNPVTSMRSLAVMISGMGVIYGLALMIVALAR